jgi:hypothetical protein
MRIFEIISEFRADVPGVEKEVKCRIMKSMRKDNEFPFYFELSHYYSGTERSGVYYPECSYETYEITKTMLFAYMEAFNTSFKVEENLNY